MRDRDYENPIITRTEREGMPDDGVQEEKRCPVCGRLADEFALDEYGDVVGCRECLIWKYADEVDI